MGATAAGQLEQSDAAGRCMERRRRACVVVASLVAGRSLRSTRMHAAKLRAIAVRRWLQDQNEEAGPLSERNLRGAHVCQTAGLRSGRLRPADLLRGRLCNCGACSADPWLCCNGPRPSGGACCEPFGEWQPSARGRLRAADLLRGRFCGNKPRARGAACGGTQHAGLRAAKLRPADVCDVDATSSRSAKCR